jgi:hypothetical protein
MLPGSQAIQCGTLLALVELHPADAMLAKVAGFRPPDTKS